MGGGFIPLNPILNGISGRTKKLKNRVAIDANTSCMNKYRLLFSEDLFLANPLPKDRIIEFFFYVSETETFKRLCDLKNDLKIYQFLTQKLIAFKANLKN